MRTDAAHPPDPCATQRAAQGHKGAQQAPTTCMMTANHKATGPCDHYLP